MLKKARDMNHLDLSDLFLDVPWLKASLEERPRVVGVLNFGPSPAPSFKWGEDLQPSASFWDAPSTPNVLHRTSQMWEVQLPLGPEGLHLKVSSPDDKNVRVRCFTPRKDGTQGPAQQSAFIREGDYLTHIKAAGGEHVRVTGGVAQVAQLLQQAEPAVGCITVGNIISLVFHAPIGTPYPMNCNLVPSLLAVSDAAVPTPRAPSPILPMGSSTQAATSHAIPTTTQAATSHEIPATTQAATSSAPEPMLDALKAVKIVAKVTSRGRQSKPYDPYMKAGSRTVAKT
jgi:hypothetical protein